MKRFKKILLPMQGHNKNELHWLYNTKQSPVDEEPPLIFDYLKLCFWFAGTGRRNSEKLLLYIRIPRELVFEKCSAQYGKDTAFSLLPVENYLLRLLSPRIRELGEVYRNTDKNIREKVQFFAQEAGEIVVFRNGLCYSEEETAFIFRLNFHVPLVNALSVNAKAAVRAVRDILEQVNSQLAQIDKEQLLECITVYQRQQEIRGYLRENKLCAFVAEGSILPRKEQKDCDPFSDSNKNRMKEPMDSAVPFMAPKELSVTISFSDGTTICGMGIRRGVTVITGGGYSGKSTLLDALEMGIYNHIPGDGREYVITDASALKIYAEDGRPVSNVDISPFFLYNPGEKGQKDSNWNKTDLKFNGFSTLHASGSVSQAANIVEAVCGGSKLLLVDEDKSATNFMIRDKIMRSIVKHEPIIPFTDRVNELCEEKEVSTILVIGGSSEYLSRADTVLLMEDYVPKDITKEIKSFLPQEKNLGYFAKWQISRRLVPKKTSQPFLYFQSVETENEKRILLDGYSADITHLTAMISGGQLNTLAYLMEKLLTDLEADQEELMQKIERYLKEMREKQDTMLLSPGSAERFYEEVRALDAFCCINRMRGVEFQFGERITQ